MTTATTTVSRRAWLSRLLLAAAVAPVVGVSLADDVDASKKGKKKADNIKKRAKVYADTCVAGGGTATTTKRPGGTTVACSGHAAGDWACTVSSGKDRCHATRTTSPVSGPITPVTGGVDPTGGDPGDGGGDKPWQGDVPDDLPVLEPVPDGGSDPVLT